MNKNLKIYLLFFAIVMILLAVLQLNKKPIIDWNRNFGLQNKAPFGLSIFNHEANDLFQNKIIRINQQAHDFYSESNHLKKHNILIVPRRTESIDTESWKIILKKVKEGSNLMILTYEIPETLSQELEIDHYNLSFIEGKENILHFTDASRSSQLMMNRLPFGLGLMKLGNPHTKILGTVSSQNNPYQLANFILIPKGKGKIYLHLEPLFITNYYLLQNHQYAEDVFSYLPLDLETYWFIRKKEAHNPSPLSFILQNPALKYTWYLLLAGSLFFIIFHAKRKQRVIPILPKVENTSVEFVRNISNLYLNEGNAEEMMYKKTLYFLHKIREELLIDTSILDEEFAHKLHVKTNAPTEQIAAAIIMIKEVLERKHQYQEKDLISYNQLLNQIYH